MIDDVCHGGYPEALPTRDGPARDTLTRLAHTPEPMVMSKPMRDFALEVHFSRWEFVARHNLAASDAESMPLRDLLDVATDEERAAFYQTPLSYVETWGTPQLRHEIAATYQTAQPEHVLCFSGAQEAIFVAMRVLLGASDHAIVVTPNYQSAETVPLSICPVSGVPLEADRGWDLDIDRLSAAIRPNTKLVSINFPNNPTGRIIGHATLEALIALCRKHGLWLFSDEVYRLIERDPAMRLRQAFDAYERGISLGVMSKAYGLPGLRIGWLACRDRDVLQRCERLKHYLSICNAAPSEILAGIALRARDRLLARNRRIVERNLQHLDEFFARFAHLFRWNRPDGGCVGFVRYLGQEGVETFTRRLVEDAGVLLLPASVYRSDLNDVPQDHFRVGYGRSGLPDALAATSQWLERGRA